MLLPNHYAAQLGVPLAGLGAVLLATRALDAIVDPWLGRVIDRGLARPRGQVLGTAALAALLMLNFFHQFVNYLINHRQQFLLCL